MGKITDILKSTIEYSGPTDSPLPFHQAGRAVFKGGLCAEWMFGKLSGPYFGIFTDDDARVITMGVGGPLGRVWVSFPDRGLRIREMAKRLAGTEFEFEDVDIVRACVHDGALWWNFFHSTYQSKAGEPRWQRGSFHPLDWAIGPIRSHEEEKDDEIVELGFPEGAYRWRIKVFTSTLRRRRWPWVWDVVTTYKAEPEGENDDIPIPGKGESGWDCGPDSLQGQSGIGGLTEAIGSIYSSVLRTRLRRGGSASYAERPRSPGAEAN